MFGIRKKKPKFDERIAKIFDDNGFKYQIDDGGVFHFGYQFNTGKSHRGFIHSETYEISNVELREINSTAFDANEILDPSIYRALLKENQNVKIGAWGIVVSDQGNEYITFTIRVPAELPSEQLFEAMYIAVSSAYTIEERLSV